MLFYKRVFQVMRFHIMLLAFVCFFVPVPAAQASESHVFQAAEPLPSSTLPDAKRQIIRKRIEKRFGHLSPEDRRKKLSRLRAERQKLRMELEHLPPKARMQRMRELRLEYSDLSAQEDK